MDFDIIYNGIEKMDYIIMVTREDKLVQNPDMAEQSLKLIDSVKCVLYSKHQ